MALNFCGSIAGWDWVPERPKTRKAVDQKGLTKKAENIKGRKFHAVNDFEYAFDARYCYDKIIKPDKLLNSFYFGGVFFKLSIVLLE